jgi:hypothetical protein
MYFHSRQPFDIIFAGATTERPIVIREENATRVHQIE